MTEEVTPHPSIDDFHQDRSKFVDAFATVERAVTQLLLASRTPIGCEPFAEKIKLLRNAKPAPQYSKAQKAKVVQTLQGIEDLVSIRNDIVHSRLIVAPVDDEWIAIFVNARQASGHTKTARMISQAGFRKLNGELAALAKALLSA